MRASSDGRPRALVVDPTPSFRTRLAEELTVLGYEVACAAALPLALTQAARVPPALVVSELHFPGACPGDVVRAWLAVLGAAPLAIVTAYSDVDASIVAIRLGAAAVLTKPATGREVLAAVADPCAHDAAVDLTLEEATRRYLFGVLTEVRSLREAARHLRVERRSLRRMLSRFGWKGANAGNTGAQRARTPGDRGALGERTSGGRRWARSG